MSVVYYIWMSLVSSFESVTSIVSCVRGRSNVLFVVGGWALDVPPGHWAESRCLASDDCGGS